MKILGTEMVIRRKALRTAVLMALCAIVFAGCAYGREEARDMWQQVAMEYPDCKTMPTVITFDNGQEGGFYVVGRNVVVIDKYASADVWRHEFRHACGDTLGESPILLSGNNVNAWIESYQQQTKPQAWLIDLRGL